MTELSADDLAPATPLSGWTDVTPHPWRRLFARWLDMALLGWGVMLAISGLVYLTSPDAEAQLVAVLEHPLLQFIGGALYVVLTAPLIALSVAWTGLSPGKWLMGVRVLRLDRQRLTLRQAFGREVTVAFSGMALAFPFICLLTQNKAYETLIKRGVTTWDDGRYVVVHRPQGPLQVVLMTFGILAWIGVALVGAIPQWATAFDG